MCEGIPKSKGHAKINKQVNKYFNNWILQHPQVVQSLIVNDFLKLCIDGQSEPQLVTKVLRQVSV